MRKVIFISILIITCILFFLIISFGFKLGPINILGYDEVEAANINKKILLNELTNKNEKEFKEKEKELKEVIQDYKETQSAYDELITIKKANKPIEDYLTLYDFDEIWKILENYSKDKNIVLNLDAVKSDTVMAVSSKYNVYDLKFKISGEYINITDFIYALEDDDRLSFEIDDFKLQNINESLESTFVVKEIPILNKN